MCVLSLSFYHITRCNTIRRFFNIYKVYKNLEIIDSFDRFLEILTFFYHFANFEVNLKSRIFRYYSQFKSKLKRLAFEVIPSSTHFSDKLFITLFLK